MAKRKQAGNSGKTAKNSTGKTQEQIPVKTLAGSALLLLAVLGISLVIKEIRFRSAVREPVVQAPEITEPVEITETAEEPRQREPEILIVEEEVPIEQVYVEPEPVPEQPVQQQQTEAYGWNNWQGWQWDSQQMEDAIQWMSWASNLTREERMQLMQSSMTSMISLMQRWQNMSPEEVQEERAQWEEVIQQWRNLPSEDRQQGIQMIQQQLEEWLQTGQ
jgi:hypothetical protein